jgi:hypothetical protein
LEKVGNGQPIHHPFVKLDVRNENEYVHLDEKFFCKDVISQTFGSPINLDGCENRIILTPVNKDCDEINKKVLEALPE